MNPNMSIGGDYVCPKCHQRCSGAVIHDCPEEKKQRRMTDYNPNERTEVTCPTCGKKRMVLKRLHNRPFFGDPNICSECRRRRENIRWGSKQ